MKIARSPHADSPGAFLHALGCLHRLRAGHDGDHYLVVSTIASLFLFDFGGPG